MEKDFLNQARTGKTGGLTYFASILFILFMWQLAGGMPYGVLYIFFPRIDPIWLTVALLVSFVFFLAAIFLAVVLIHQRKFSSLITPELPVSFKRMGQGFFAWAVLTLLTSLVDYLIRPDFYAVTFDVRRWLLFAVFGGILVIVQAATEEIFFRGYILQGLGLLTRSRIFLVVGSGLLFALPHLLNPEVSAGLLLIVGFYFLFGCFLTWITLRDNRLELAIGVHAANNLFAALLVNYEGSALPTPAVLTARGIDPLANLAWFLTGAALFYLWFFVYRKKQPETAIGSIDRLG